MAIYKVHNYIGSRKWNDDTWRWEYSRADGEIVMERNKQYLVFTKEWAPSRTYMYDLSTGEFIRVIHKKSGENKEERVARRNAANWFGKCDIVTSDPKFARLFAFAKITNNRHHGYSNPSWDVDLLATPRSTIMEQWLSIGFKFQEIERQMMGTSPYIGYREHYEVFHAPNEYNKKLMKYLREKYVDTGNEITFTKLNEYYEYWNNGQYNVFKQIEKKIEEQPQYMPVFNCPIATYSSYDRDVLHDESANELRNLIITTMQEYNLELNAFLEYCLYLSHSESIHLGKLMSDYPDYLRRELYLQGGKMSKMNKYPEHWLTTTHKQQKEFSKLQQLDRMEQEGGSYKFNNSIEANKHLEWKNGNYLIRMPEGAEDIRDEASQMNHCVATYIPDIEDGKRIVMFMRDVEHPERSLVTVEVINGAITQAYAKNDDHPTTACKIWLMKWAREKDLRMTAVTLS